MPLDQTENFVRGEVSATINQGDTTIEVENASEFPDPSNGSYNLVLWNAGLYAQAHEDSDVEIVRITGRDTSSDELTAQRGQEGTADTSHPSSSELQLAYTRKLRNDLETRVSGLSDDGESLGQQNDRVDAWIDEADINSISGSAAGEGNSLVNLLGDGLVVAIGDGLGSGDAIDPSTTSTPVADACGLSGAATVLLPPTGVDEAATLTVPGSTTIRGSLGNSAITFTDETSDGIVVDGESNVTIDGVTINGGSGRTANSAIRFTGTSSHWNFGRALFHNWQGSDPVIHFDTGHPFSYNWGTVRCFSSAEGTFIQMDSSGGSGGSIDIVYAGGGTSSADAIDVAQGGGQVTINRLNVGGSYRRALHFRGLNGLSSEVGFINYEPSGGAGTDVIRKQDTGVLRIGGGICQADVDQVYSLHADNGRAMLPRPRPDGTVANNFVNITDTPQVESWYYGPESDIQNDAGSSTGLVRSMATAGTGNG